VNGNSKLPVQRAQTALLQWKQNGRASRVSRARDFVASRSIRRPKRAVIVLQGMFRSIHADTALKNTADLCHLAVRGHYYERIKSVLDDAKKAVCSLDLFLSRRSVFARQGLNIKNRLVGLCCENDYDSRRRCSCIILAPISLSRAVQKTAHRSERSSDIATAFP
jgi:hypothetical protein